MNEKCNSTCSSMAKCDIFDFMAKHVGMTVIHPGGFKATNKLLKLLNIKSTSKVVDIACGKGTTAILIAQEYGCNVEAIDIDEALIDEARYLTKKKGLAHKINYHAGDALKLPFSDNEFDAAVSQAMLVLVADKTKAIQEARRVIKIGAVAGWLELSWKREITAEFIVQVSTVICAYCMTNVNTYDGWKRIFTDAGINNAKVLPIEFKPDGGSMAVMKDEGFLRTLSIMFNIMRNKEIRDRIKIMNGFFREYRDVFGCGIYYFEKK